MKKVVITYTHPPYGTSHFMEGLRLASGMPIDDHEAKLVFLGDGAFCALKDVDMRPAEMFLETIGEFGYPFYVERESLLEHGIDEADINPTFKVASQGEISKMLQDCDIHLDV